MNCCDNKMNMGCLLQRQYGSCISGKVHLVTTIKAETNYKGAFIKIIQKLFLKKMRSYRN